MKLPDVQSEKLRKALLTFDFTLRPHPHWDGWEESAGHDFVICDADKFYPVKKIVSLATGAHEDSFNMNEARHYVSIRKLRTVKPLEELERIEQKKAATTPPKPNKKASPRPANWENAVIKNYFDATALAGRIQFFKQYRTGSFDTSYYNKEEREYKAKAIDLMHELLNKERLGELLQKGNIEEGLRSMKAVTSKNKNNMLTMYDQIQLFNVPAEKLVPGLYQLLYGDAVFSARFSAWVELISQAKTTCWPAATFYLALSDPQNHFFVRPQPTHDFLDAIKSDLTWEPHTNYGYYFHLLKLANLLVEELKPLAPKESDRKVDLIDVQSFIWMLRTSGDKAT
jgi:hypothetical protein